MREEGRKGVEYATQVSGVDNKAGCLLRRAPEVGEGEGSGFWGKGDGVSFGHVKSGCCWPPKGGIKSSLGCGRGRCTRGARGSDGVALGTLAFKGQAEEERSPKVPRLELAARGQGG